MKVWFIVLYSIFLSIWYNCGSADIDLATKIFCHKPTNINTVESLKTSGKYVIYGDSTASNGLGNELIFFPAVYYFAAFTGRNILIEDSSLLGKMCKIVNCGIPLRSSLFNTFRSKDYLTSILKLYMEGKAEVTDQIIRIAGNTDVGTWYYYYKEALSCACRISQCNTTTDEDCPRIFAFHQLVRGPLLPSHDLDRLSGAAESAKKDLQSLNVTATIFDAVLHFRFQFDGFEKNQMKLLDSEVRTWLESKKSQVVFEAIRNRLFEKLEHRLAVLANLSALTSPTLPLSSSSQSSLPHVRVYMACDNARLKQVIYHYLSLEAVRAHKFDMSIVYMKSEKVHHASTLHKTKDHRGFYDLVVDWYAIAVSDNPMVYRRTGGGSTFSTSAAMVNGRRVERLEAYDTCFHWHY